MIQRLKMAYVKGKTAVCNKVRNFFSEEKGASDMVAVIVLIVIIIAAAIIFRSQLIEAVNTVFGQLTEFIGG